MKKSEATMPLLHDMAEFAVSSTFNDISKEAREQLKIRVLEGGRS